MSRYGPVPKPPVERFWRYVEKTDGCWLWAGGLHKKGYGTFHWKQDGTTGHGAHRFSYILHYGPLEPGMYVCHHCDNPRCVRPDHLFAGTNIDNMLDAQRKGRLSGNKTGRTRHSRLTWAQVQDIAARRRSGETMSAIGDRYGISRSTVMYWERICLAEGEGARRRFWREDAAA